MLRRKKKKEGTKKEKEKQASSSKIPSADIPVPPELLNQEEDQKELKTLESDLGKMVSGPEITEADVASELRALAKEIAEEQQEEDYKGQKIDPRVKEILPIWVEKPIYWITPKERLKARREQWLEEWSQLIIAFTAAKQVYVIAVRDLLNEFPFKNPIVNKDLNRDQLILVFDQLVQEKRAKALDRKKTRYFVYWQSIDEMADDLFEWAQDRGQEIIGIFELSEEPRWETLPDEQVIDIFTHLVRDRKAFWLDRKNKDAGIKLEFIS